MVRGGVLWFTRKRITRILTYVDTGGEGRGEEREKLIGE